MRTRKKKMSTVCWIVRSGCVGIMQGSPLCRRVLSFQACLRIMRSRKKGFPVQAAEPVAALPDVLCKSTGNGSVECISKTAASVPALQYDGDHFSRRTLHIPVSLPLQDFWTW